MGFLKTLTSISASARERPASGAGLQYHRETSCSAGLWRVFFKAGRVFQSLNPEPKFNQQ